MINQDVSEERSVDERLDRLYAELAEVERAVILARAAERTTQSPAPGSAVDQLRAIAEEVSAKWSGPSAVEEIRSQRSS